MIFGKTYGNIVLNCGEWVMSDVEPHVAIKLKNLFKKIPVHSTGPFRFTNTSEQCADLEWFMTRYPLAISDKDLKELRRQKKLFYDAQAEMERILSPNFVPHPLHTKKGQQLRVYQAQAIEVLYRSKSLLVGDDVGLGKTYVGIGACLREECLPAIIVVQTHLVGQWKEKIESFSNLRTHCVKGTKPYNLPSADVYIIKYSCLAGWVDVFAQNFFKMAIFDEIQEIRTGTSSNKGCGAKILAEHTKWHLGLSATPMYNYADEIWNILNILKEDCLGTYAEFQREWGGGMVGMNKISVRNPDALGTYLREQHLFLRRTKADVGQALAPVNKIVETVGYDEKTVKSAEELAAKLAIKATYGQFVERGQAARELDLMVRHMTGVSKAKYVAEFVRILLENGEPVLLAGWHRDVYGVWLRELAEFNPVMYTGSESDIQKERAKQAFLSGESNLFIISLRSGIGLDGLQYRCSTAVIGELDWSPQVHHQIIGRLDREGQENPVMAIYLCSDSGSDPLIVDLIGLKSSQAQGVIDPGLGVQPVHSDQTRIQLLVQKFLKKKDIPVSNITPNGMMQEPLGQENSQLQLL